MIQNPTSDGIVSIELIANLAAMLVRWQDKFGNWGRGTDPEPNADMDPDYIKAKDIIRTLYIKATQKNVGRSGRG